MKRKKLSIYRKRNCRRFKLFSAVKSISVIGVTLVSLNIFPLDSLLAETLDTTQNTSVSSTTEDIFNQNSSNEIQEFVNDVRSFVRVDLFGNIEQFVRNSIGSVEIPDLGQVISEIMTGSLPRDGIISNKLENNLPNSYAIRQDLANQSQRLGAIEVAQNKTLAKNAQQKSLENLELSADAEIESTQMSDDSQNSDTSQQILQNISQQLKNNATIANLQYQEASFARQNKALELNLTAQIAQELNTSNISDRQTQIATGNSTIFQGSLLMMSGVSVLGQPNQ